MQAPDMNRLSRRNKIAQRERLRKAGCRHLGDKVVDGNVLRCRHCKRIAGFVRQPMRSSNNG